MSRKGIILFAMLILSLGRLTAEVFHVAPEGNPFGAWTDCVALEEALSKAQPGDEIWVQGFDVITDIRKQIYRPSGEEGFTLRSGVALYGGFRGNETDKSQRPVGEQAFEFAYRSVLSGDIELDDVVDAGLIYPENATRGDNVRVLTIDLRLESSGNDGRKPTVFDGFSVFSGQADKEFGGGVKVIGGGLAGSYRITRCFFVNNYAEKGGAVYVDESVAETNNADSYIGQCMAFNNVAGTSMNETDAGGGIYLAGYGVVVNSVVANNVNGGICMGVQGRVLNSTVVRNTGGGIGMASAYDGGFNVFNTVVWGNHALYSLNAPKYQNSAFPEQEQIGNGNVAVNEENVKPDGQSVFFTSPSIKAGYDHLFEWKFRKYPYWNWNLQENSVLIDKGAGEAYTADKIYGGYDLCGVPRLKGGVIDIGACEYQPLSDDRVRYVSSRGDDSDGKTWETAYKTVQRAIDDLYGDGSKGEGEVWVREGVYEPTVLLVPGENSTASFIMRDGIHVYGGFEGTETTRAERKRGTMPWDFQHKTVFQGAGYRDETLTWNNNRWSLSSSSNHVVWFAHPDGKTAFEYTTVLDGVVITGGQATMVNAGKMFGDRGAGVYMHNANAKLANCVVWGNVAEGCGGGVWLSGGRIISSLLYNNGADEDGGAVYMDNSGIVLRSMLANNASNNGAGIYMDRNGDYVEDGQPHPEYLILSTSVITNNTARGNGAVYCNEGGVLLQNTINNNEAPRATDESDPDATRTGGLFVDSYALVINSVLWNNLANGSQVPMYARNIKPDSVRFINTACSGMNNAVWNGILQEDLIELVDDNSGGSNDMSPDYEVPVGQTFLTDDDIFERRGVQGGWRDIDFYWDCRQGGNLRAQGLAISAMPEEVMLRTEQDIRGELFAHKPAVGAHALKRQDIVPQRTADGVLRLYVDSESVDRIHNGSSWKMAYRSLNEAVAFFAEELSEEELRGVHRLEIHVMEGTLYPRYAYTDNDYHTGTIRIMKMPGGLPLHIYGGYERTDNREGTLARNPLNYRCLIDGNPDGADRSESLYHVVTVDAEAKVVLDGFHVLNGLARGETPQLYGAGMLVHDEAEVTVRNCIFENNEASVGAAIDARNAVLKLENCVINNNTNTERDASVVNARSLSLNHVSVVNNLGKAWMTGAEVANSFALGNDSGNTAGLEGVAVNALNFANPTTEPGVDKAPYLGGYADFTPLTSSAEVAVIINKGQSSDLLTDIAGNGRNLGGSPDLGAYEADLPPNGTVIYVTANGGGDFSGSSWENAIAGNVIYDLQATGADKRVTEEGNVVFTTDSRYIGFYDRSARPYAETSNASRPFWDERTGNALPTIENVQVGWRKYEDRITDWSIQIKNNRDERYVSGLQYAVETASAQASGNKNLQVWVAGGTYTDYKGFVIRDKVEVLGGFPNKGTPGLDDRNPLISQDIPLRNGDEAIKDQIGKYETILQIQDKTPVVWSNNNEPSENAGAFDVGVNLRKPVLFQPDVCMTTVGPSTASLTYYDRDWGNWGYYTEVKQKKIELSDQSRFENGQTKYGTYVDYEGAIWDGFTIRHGFYNGYYANRDGGAGVRMFRGVVLKNCVVTDNYNASCRNRGGGIYCDGENSFVINCFVINNAVLQKRRGDDHGNDDWYGGGMYMIVGTGYNLLVANNYGETNGGGIFIENAKFYNNTIVYNRSNGTGGLYQYTGTMKDKSSLLVYNCIFYGNTGNALNTQDVSKFDGVHYSYVNGSIPSNIQSKIYNSKTGYDALISPFQSETAQADNDYRLKFDTWCVNNGIEVISGITLPETDVDFTDRIKDCAIDIGAYERDNDENILPQQNVDEYIYYITVGGAGSANASSPANAACMMKLQAVLNHAGTQVAEGRKVEVRVAEGEYYANTLSNPQDPQSYTFVVPYGVVLAGGYTEDFEEENRNPFSHITKLIPQHSVAGQTVNGYHAVIFGDRPEGTPDLQSVVDGCHLEGGLATAADGTDKGRGGGAIVPAWGHIRNCVVHGNEAVEGGGLYLEAGATVSGTVVRDNKAKQGGGFYAENEGASAEKRTHVVSSTIAGNRAVSVGGGAYHEDGGAMVFNSAVWGNQAPSDKNVSGVFAVSYEDELFAGMVADPAGGQVSGQKAFTPYNYCFVETYNMPSLAFNNTSMLSDDKYFAGGDYRLKAYSELIKHGAECKYLTYLAGALGVAEQDMAGIGRVQTNSDRTDVGAFAFENGLMPIAEDDIRRLIFVSVNSKPAELQKGEGIKVEDYVGRSFLTPITWLDDALEYIRQVRETYPDLDDEFKILVAGGTYMPRYRRENAELDKRNNSFEIPEGVGIYGGFSGEEGWTDGLTEIPTLETDSRTLTPVDDGNFARVLSGRTFSDLNGNGVFEAYELENQTIFSGRLSESEEGYHAYHVLFSESAGGDTSPRPVVLDGVTVMEGDCYNSDLTQEFGGRGGAIYSKGVPYVIYRSRLSGNKAKEGGAVYLHQAGLTVFGSLFAGNEAKGSDGWTNGGGAVCLVGNGGTLLAVNTIWANNEADRQGGAIAVAGTNTGINLMNCLLVRNKAGEHAVIHSAGTTALTNTAVWGNENGGGANSFSGAPTFSHCATDEDGLFGRNDNIRLNGENTAIDGPRFAAPSTIAGVAGYSAMSHWNPGAVSILADGGDGVLEEEDMNMSVATGAYQEWITKYMPECAGQYMAKKDYKRYVGRLTDSGGKDECRIDIGVYEYQYPRVFTAMDEVYVSLTESGTGDGSSWANATSDLRGAIIGLANSTGKAQAKKVHVKAGEYAEHRLTMGTAYTLEMGTADFVETDSLIILGSYDASGKQDFSNPTVIGVSPVDAGKDTEWLMDIKTNGKTVVLNGITFDGSAVDDITPVAGGIKANVNKDEDGGEGRLSVKNTAFRHTDTGMVVDNQTNGTALLVNTLFADGVTGLNASDRTEVVNATFVKNETAVAGRVAENIYNSVFWENGTDGDNIATPDHYNVIFEKNQKNDDVLHGPNFVDPENGDYRLRPSDLLLDKGDSISYKDRAGLSPADDLDLAGQSRRVGGSIDVGAYEYNAPLQPIVYVNQNVVGGDESGSSWENAVRDLQSAVDLATLYSKESEGRSAYVFAYNTTKASNLNLSLDGVKVYGGMNGESVSAGVDAEDVEAQVGDLLSKRTPILSAVNRSQIENLSLSAGGVVDGFEVADADIRGGAGADGEITGWGMLSGSIVEKAHIGEEGILYNSFLTESPAGTGRLVNVTLGAGAEIPAGMDTLHVAERVPVNGYVGGAKEIWNRQLMEDSEYIDKGGDEKSIQAYMDYAGHKLDLSGSPRVMNGQVDYGCFETWNVGGHFVQDIQTVPTAEGLRPTANHVVYVREGVELNLREGSYAEGNAFNPCFLLLEHKAGLRGNGNWIALEHLGVERVLDSEGLDMAVMPFRVDSLAWNGTRVEDLENTRLLYRYNGDKRARHDYKFVASGESDAWEKLSSVAGGRTNLTEGWLLAGNKNDTVRFYGGSYAEDGRAKEIVLPQHNFRESWNNFAEGVRFTHMENMGWNLFGSPFLCAMNYEDMEYGRVIYPYAGGAYASPELTWNRDNNQSLDGYLPPFTAVFTQTATIRNEEVVDVQVRTAELKEAKAYYGRLAIAFAQTTGNDSTAFEDMIQLTAVPSSEAEESFNLHTDGVKQGRIQAVRPQIYMLRDGGRYSLLSAVDVEGSVRIGVSTGEAGLFEFRIPADCDTYDYETVLLKDAGLNRMVDLKEQSYGITLSESGEQNDRFTLYFKRQSDRFTDNGITLFTPEDGMLAIKGLSGNSTVRLYSVEGWLVEVRATSAHQEIFRLPAGTYLVEIAGGTQDDPLVEKVYVE